MPDCALLGALLRRRAPGVHSAGVSQDAGAVAKAALAGSSDVQRMQIVEGYFRDDRWVNGTWDFAAFQGANGETDWDLVRR